MDKRVKRRGEIHAAHGKAAGEENDGNDACYKVW